MSELGLNENPTEIPQGLSPETELQAENLARIVSKSATENQKPTRNKKTPAPRRAGGRPRKDGQPNKATLKLMGLDSDPLDASQGDGSPGPSPGPGEPSSFADALDIPPEMMAPILKLPFDLARNHTGFQGFALPDEIAASCGPLLQHVLKQYLPEANSPHLPVIILATTLGTHFAMQAQQFAEWKKNKHSDPTPTPPNAQVRTN